MATICMPRREPHRESGVLTLLQHSFESRSYLCSISGWSDHQKQMDVLLRQSMIKPKSNNRCTCPDPLPMLVLCMLHNRERSPVPVLGVRGENWNGGAVIQYDIRVFVSQDCLKDPSNSIISRNQVESFI